ncbi:hypothetical protein QNI19_29805 [Cytophagaceae bacterium DM2B3-1]|uniref:Gliding motility protein GldL-like N-terminal domain-containing protein n=1 Tax=Xanthocytophaga flava TaxID=3048013 RepID=A0ABT7CU18_9BACT|nr:hypothetical protein [Xanthocytophaga flavus]MDJ1497171.1 hypothetical protein [Xanthocytophaga flavus]
MISTKNLTINTIVLLIGAFFILLCWNNIAGNYFPESIAGFWRFEQIVRFLALFLILSQSQIIIHKLYFSGIVISNVIMIMGFMFKIMHWPMAMELLVAGCILSMLIYVISFLIKSTKSHLDILKVLWVLVMYITVLLVMYDVPYRHEWIGLPSILFWIMFFDFVYVTYRKAEQA